MREKPNTRRYPTKGLLDDIYNDKYSKKKLVSWYWPLVILTFGICLFYIVHLIDQMLPRPIEIDELKYNLKQFSAERSRIISERLTNLGPRVVGSILNEVRAPEIIEDEVKQIIKNASPRQSIILQRQKGSGAYNLGFKPPFTNVYDNIQNVIVMLEGRENSHSILVNCHYDTVPTSSGASDDAISCAAMLETLRVLSLALDRLKHNIIFLFNGAEEVPLQAAHLFLQHEWAPKCKIFLNLEAAGCGGSNYLFQTSHLILLKYYADSVPHPRGQVFSEELFQSGMIPSDTDFRVFRDFGNMSGLDFAFWQNGYVYHTKYDSERYIPLGSHQNLGDNTVALLQALGNALDLDDINLPSEKMVYYDYIGFFMIRYNMTWNNILNTLTILFLFINIALSLGFPVRRLILQEFIWKIFGQFFAIIGGVVISTGMGFFIDKFSPFAMPWYSTPVLVFPLYACPYIIFHILTQYFMDKWRTTKYKMSTVKSTQLSLIAAQIPWVLLMICLMLTNSKSSSLLFPLLICSVIANTISWIFSVNGYKWIWMYIFAYIPALCFNMYGVCNIFMLFIPILGRAGPVNADAILAGSTAILTVFLIGFAIPLMTVIEKPIRTVIILLILCIGSALLILTANLGHPYSVNSSIPRPQRYLILHAQRQFEDEFKNIRRNESGYLIYNLDRNSPRTIPLDRSTFKSLEEDCLNELYCGIPLLTSRTVGISSRSTWIPSLSPSHAINTELILENKKFECVSQSNVCEASFILKGPDRLTVTFAPRAGASLVNWTLPTEILPSGEWQGRPAYFVHIVRGSMENDLRITLRFNVSNELMQGSPILDIGIAGHDIHNEKISADFQTLIAKFPKWTHVTSWTSAYKFYVFPHSV